MKVASWNIQGMGMGTDKGREKWAFLKKGECFRGAIILLQEIRLNEGDLERFMYMSAPEGWDAFVHCAPGSRGGVAILVPKRYEAVYISRDSEGRRLTVKLNEKGESMHVTCVYGHSSKKNLRYEWIETLKVPKGRSIVGGDWNMTMRPEDRSSGVVINGMVERFSDWMINNALVDATADLMHTHFDQRSSALLDRIFVSGDITDVKAFNGVTTLSDHHPVWVSWGGSKGGPWKLNPSILTKSWVEGAKGHIADLWGAKGDAAEKWESIKGCIAKDAKSTARIRANAHKEKMDDFMNKIKQCTERKDFTSVNTYRVLMEEECVCYAKSTVGNQLKVIPKKSACIFKWGKAHKWNKMKNSIGARLKNKDGVLVGAKEVVEEFYRDIYKRKDTDEDAKDRWVNKIIMKVSDEDAQACDKEITEEELREAIKVIKPGKSPGGDGLGIEMYKQVPLMSKWLLQAWKEGLRKGVLWRSAREAMIRLIYKKDDKEKVGNFRPISLCNTDYKIIAKVLAERIKGIIPKVVPEEQVGFVQGRDIRSNVVLARAVLEKIRNGDQIGGLLLLDCEKAYDRVDRRFVWACLKKLGFGDNFIRMVAVLHEETVSRVLYKGGISDTVEMESGVRQGCPLAPLLFVIHTIPLIMGLKEEKACEIGKAKVTVLAFADDTVVYYKDEQDARKKMEMVEDYGKASAAKLNRNKTECVSWSLPGQLVSSNNFYGPLKCTRLLGAPISVTGDVGDLWKNMVNAAISTLSSWRAISFSIFDKARICNIYIISRFQYIFNYERMPKEWRQRLEKKMKFFIFGKIMSNRCLDEQTKAPIAVGGVGLLDIDLQNRATLAHWIVRRKEPGSEDWKEAMIEGDRRGIGVMSIISEAAAGVGRFKLERGWSIKDVKLCLRGKTWGDDQFTGWGDIPLQDKIVEFKWRIRYKKVKVPRKEFVSYDNCLWCGSLCNSNHLFYSCNVVKAEIVDWRNKLKISDADWDRDKVDGLQENRIAKEVVMTHVKWGIWKSYASKCYGNEEVHIKTAIDNSVKLACLYLVRKEEFVVLLNVRKLFATGIG